MFQHRNTYVVVGVVGVVLAALLVYMSSGCTEIGDLTPERGSHGYRVWGGPTFKSFEHRGQDICVSDEWQAVGAIRTGEGTAQFERGTTGVLIKKDSFGLRTLEPQGSPYAVAVLYPLTLSRQNLELASAQIAHAFTEVATLYGDSATTPRRPHTVLITVGLAEKEAVYPDPTGNLSLYVYAPTTERGEALFIHAVMHLYNRFSGDTPYLATQWPFNGGEFQELEATWAEVALTTRARGAFERLNYLYRVHAAVVAQDPGLITAPPFNDVEAFKKIVPTILVPPGAPYLDVQYGHYILAPLTMAAIDALLHERGTGVTVRTLLTDIHTGRRDSFMDALAGVLPDKDMKAINAWIIADAQIPVLLIQKAIALYDR